MKTNKARKFRPTVVPLVHMAAEDIASGKSKREVIERLKQSGCQDELALDIFNEARALKKSAFRGEGQAAMLGGGIVFMIGLVISLASLMVAESSGGGFYLVAYGAVLTGGGAFLKGLWQTIKG